MIRSEDSPSPEKRKKRYRAMLDSVEMIDRLMNTEETSETLANLDNNIRHLELMKSKEYWTADEDMTEVDKSVSLGGKHRKTMIDKGVKFPVIRSEEL